MSKKPMTWMDVIREQLAKLRSEGKTPSIGDVTPYAKKEWAEIKSGKHPLYVQASNKGKSMSKGKSISKGKSKTKIYKYLNSQKGGDCNTCMNSGGGGGGGGGAEPSTPADGSEQAQMGGKGRRKGKSKNMKKSKGMKGGEKEPYVDINSKSGLKDGDEEANGTDEIVEHVEDTINIE
jgi:hypothetical protein